MEIVKHSRIIESVRYSREFAHPDQIDEDGRLMSGWGFECDEAGAILPVCDEATGNLAGCLAGAMHGRPVVDLGVRVERGTYREPAIGLCECGREVVLDGFTCPCECGRDYNSSGQLLAPRECWGEETGEHWTECF